MASSAVPNELKTFLTRSWKGYCAITPDASHIHELLVARGEEIVNDHVAFRTFDLPGISRPELGRYFERYGYERAGEDMLFPEKCLLASYWKHPDPTLPKIFISELELRRVSAGLREWIENLVESRGGRDRELTTEFFLGRSWNAPDFEDYRRFYPESEYAAWTAAFGIRVNHFTIRVNALKSFSGLAELDEFLIGRGFVLNAAGGVIKGSRAEGLEQSSTVAKRIPWVFAGGRKVEVMSCYYEFAARHPLPGQHAFFEGFVPSSADKIFESTYESKSSRGG